MAREVVSSTTIPLTGAAVCGRAAVLTTSGGHSLAGIRPGIERDERLAGRADAELQILLDGEVADRESRASGSLRVVLVRRRRAEQWHHCVADELLHRAAVPLELCTDQLVVRAEDRLDVLGIKRLRPRCEPTRSQKTTVTTFRSRRGVSPDVGQETTA